MHCVNDWSARSFAHDDGIAAARQRAIELEAEFIFNTTHSPYKNLNWHEAVVEMPETYQALIELNLAAGKEDAFGRLLSGWIRSYWYTKAYEQAENQINNIGKNL